jgi:hypothetical protein
MLQPSTTNAEKFDQNVKCHSLIQKIHLRLGYLICKFLNKINKIDIITVHLQTKPVSVANHLSGRFLTLRRNMKTKSKFY